MLLDACAEPLKDLFGRASDDDGKPIPASQARVFRWRAAAVWIHAVTAARRDCSLSFCSCVLQVKAVLLVGGATRMPAVRKIVKGITDMARCVDVRNPRLSEPRTAPDSLA